MLLLDGKTASTAVKNEVREETLQILAKGKRAPHLAAILVGTNGASETYVASKVKNCEEVGFRSTLIRLDSDVAEKVLLEAIAALNNET